MLRFLPFWYYKDTIYKKGRHRDYAIIIEDPKYELKSQFRCNGSDEYINWVEDILYNKKVGDAVEYTDYELRLFDNLLEMQREIKKRNAESSYPSRMLSGDVFPWISMNDKTQIDINIGDFHAQWNKKKSFAVDPNSIDEVGCIHTSQGMEFEHVGLIIGDDLIYRNGKIKTNYLRHPESAGEFKRPYQRRPKAEDEPIIDLNNSPILR